MTFCANKRSGLLEPTMPFYLLGCRGCIPSAQAIPARKSTSHGRLYTASDCLPARSREFVFELAAGYFGQPNSLNDVTQTVGSYVTRYFTSAHCSVIAFEATDYRAIRSLHWGPPRDFNQELFHYRLEMFTSLLSADATCQVRLCFTVVLNPAPPIIVGNRSISSATLLGLSQHAAAVCKQVQFWCSRHGCADSRDVVTALVAIHLLDDVRILAGSELCPMLITDDISRGFNKWFSCYRLGVQPVRVRDFADGQHRHELEATLFDTIIIKSSRSPIPLRMKLSLAREDALCTCFRKAATSFRMRCFMVMMRFLGLCRRRRQQRLLLAHNLFKPGGAAYKLLLERYPKLPWTSTAFLFWENWTRGRRLRYLRVKRKLLRN